MEKRLDIIEDQIKTLFNKQDDLASNLKVISDTNTKVIQKVEDMSIILNKMDRYLQPDLTTNKPGVVMQTQYNLEDIIKERIRIDGAFHRISEVKDKHRDLSTKFTAWEVLVKELTKKVTALDIKVTALTKKLDDFKPINTVAVVGMVTVATGILGTLVIFLK